MAQTSIKIVVDGMNVARSREKHLPHLGIDDDAAVRACVDFFRSAFFAIGWVEVKVFGAFAWTESSEGLVRLRDEGIVFGAPGGVDDDFMLQYAEQEDAFIVSNDRFLNHLHPATPGG